MSRSLKDEWILPTEMQRPVWTHMLSKASGQEVPSCLGQVRACGHWGQGAGHAGAGVRSGHVGTGVRSGHTGARVRGQVQAHWVQDST